ncbi:MAG: hypothetical protein R6U31_06905 [bacterium]
MKRVFTIVLFIIIIPVMLSAENEGFDTDYFYIYAPDGWQTGAEGDHLFYLFSLNGNYFVQIDRVDASEDYPDREMEDIDFKNFTLEDKQGLLAQVAADINVVYDGFELIDKDILEINGMEMLLVYCTFKNDEDLQVSCARGVTLKEGYYYVVTMLANGSEFSQEAEELYGNMLASFTVK